MGVEGIPHGPVSDPGHTLKTIEAEGHFVGWRTDPGVGPREASNGGPHPHPIRSQGSVLLSTDRLPRAVIGAIEKAWGCDVYDHYGATEMGLGGGVDCRTHTGYHLREADFYFEIVDPLTGIPVSDGESGEVVFSTLTRTAMPLIRYRTGDVSPLRAWTPAPAGPLSGEWRTSIIECREPSTCPVATRTKARRL